MRRIVGGLLVVAALAVAAAPAQGAESGVNLALNQNVDGPANAQRLRVGWVRIFVGWSIARAGAAATSTATTSTRRRATRSPRYRARGVKVLLVVPEHAGLGGRPARAPARRRRRTRRPTARFVAELARRCPAADAIEIWNEPDSEIFWRGAPDPAGYAALLRASYPRIKAARAGRHRGHRRHGRQPLRVPAGHLRRGRRRLLRRGRRAHRHRVPAHLAGRVLPRARTGASGATRSPATARSTT